jgi:hypothetical protein
MPTLFILAGRRMPGFCFSPFSSVTSYLSLVVLSYFSGLCHLYPFVYFFGATHYPAVLEYCYALPFLLSIASRDKRGIGNEMKVERTGQDRNSLFREHGATKTPISKVQTSQKEMGTECNKETIIGLFFPPLTTSSLRGHAMAKNGRSNG